MHRARLNGIRKVMSERGLNAFLVTNMSNVFYLSGFTGSTAAVVVTSEAAYILVDPRYSIQARMECGDGIEARDYTSVSTVEAAGQLINELKSDVVGYESENLTVASLRRLRRTTGAQVKLRSTVGKVEMLRSVKDAHEIALIKHACGIVDSTFDIIVREIKPGMTESEIALLIDSTMRRLGAAHEGFSTIAAAGINSACPHHSPVDAALSDGQFLKMDFGAEYQRYNSDITRTIFIGKPTDKHREVYQVVLNAQMKAIEAIAPGKTGREIDAVAREYIASCGYGENFSHSLGHALGIDVHDGPGFSKSSNIVLEPGMVITVEPGIYIEGWGGVRIEDDVLVTDTGHETLTTADKRLIRK
ncbi:MAG: Xaa-Pro peptidase family protein [Armatimonadota bacterium]|nr:Xaa-Pro peptidase family protein [bacterium]